MTTTLNTHLNVQSLETTPLSPERLTEEKDELLETTPLPLERLTEEKDELLETTPLPLERLTEEKDELLETTPLPLERLTEEKDELLETLEPLESLLEGLGLTSEQFNQILLLLETPLKLKPITLNGTLYLEPWQADLLTSLQPLLTDLNALQELLLALIKNGALLYRCRECGTLRLTNKVLLGTDLEHQCKEFDLHKGRYQIIASGSLDDVTQWAHSLKRGLDNPFKGI